MSEANLATAAAPLPARQFRLMHGQHEQGGRLYEAGQIISSVLDLAAMFNRPDLRPRFDEVGGRTSTGHFTFDPSTETIDQFNARVREAQVQQAQRPDGGAAEVWDRRTETLAQFAERMQRKTGQQASAPQPDQEANASGANTGNNFIPGKTDPRLVDQPPSSPAEQPEVRQPSVQQVRKQGK